MIDADGMFDLKIPRAWLLGLVLLVLAVLLGCTWSCLGRRPGTAIPPKAEAHDRAGTLALGRGEALHQIAQARDPALQTARGRVATLEGQLASLKVSLAAIAHPDLAPVVVKQDEVIQSQDHRAELLEAQLATRTAEADAKGTAAEAFRQETLVLRKALAPRPLRAAGVLWNPGDQTYGAWVDQEVGRVRIGFEVLQQRLPLQVGGNVKWAVQVRAGLTF